MPSAIKDMEDALKANAEDGRVLTNLGALQLSSGNSAEAEANVNRALQVNPSSVDARLALANFYMATNRPSDAERQSSIAFIDRQLQRRQERDKTLAADENRLRAMTDFCQAIFGLNEFIYVD